MARFVLAVLFVAAVLVIVAVFALGLRAVTAGSDAPGKKADPMQKVAFALLVALFLYVAFQGGA
jgi:hypothetical protein